MASATRKRARADALWVTCAFFCERVLREIDDTVSFIGLAGKVTITAEGQSASEQMATYQQRLYLVVGVHGPPDQKHTIRVEKVAPDGQVTPGPRWTVQFESVQAGHIHSLDTRLQFDQAGVYFFNVRSGRRLLTRVPLEVVYQTRLAASP